MTSIGIQCNIEQAGIESSSTSQSATVDAKNKLYHDNDDINLDKSDLAQILNRSDPDGMSLSHTFIESGESSSHRTKYVQDAPQEATINSEPSDSSFSPKQNREDNASTQNAFNTVLAIGNKKGKLKPCAGVTPFPRQSVKSDEEETILKTSSSGDGEEVAIYSHPNMTRSIISQRVGCHVEALRQESEQIQNNAEEIDLAQTSTEPYSSHLICPLPSIKLIKVSGDKTISLNMKGKVDGESENYILDGALRDLNCRAIQSHTKIEAQIVPQDGGKESAQEGNICNDFEGDQESSNADQYKNIFVFPNQTSDNSLNENYIKGQKVQSQCKHFAERYNGQNRIRRMKQRRHMATFKKRSRRHRIGLRRPMHTLHFAESILDKHCTGHIKKSKIKGNDGRINNLPPKGDRSTVKPKTRGKSGLKEKENSNLFSNKESLNTIYLRPKRDKLTKTSGNDSLLKLETWMKTRQKYQRLKNTPIKKMGNKRNIQSRNSLTTRQKVSREKETVYMKFKNKDNFQSKAGYTNKAKCVIHNLIIKLQIYVYVFFYFTHTHGSKTTMYWHNLYSSNLQYVISGLCSKLFVQLTVAPVRELIYCTYFANESHRRQSFRTYDNQDIVERLVRNGFFYSERDNQIICYKCGGGNGRLCDGDVPERAHRSGCQFRHETNTGIHAIRRDDIRMQSSSNPRQTSSSSYMVNGGSELIPNTQRVSLSDWTLERSQGEGHSVPGSVLHHRPQAFIDYFRRQNDPRGGRGGRSMTVIPPFPFDETHEHRRHITVIPPRPHINGGRRRRGITALPPRLQLYESVSPADGAINRTQSVTGAEAISTPSMPIFLPHMCVFCRRRSVSIRFEPCQHALACYQCSVRKVTCTQCGKIIMQKSFI